MSRVVLVTGGNRGIGLATAKRFQAAGHKVAVTARSGSGDDAKGLTVVKCDVTDTDSVNTAIDQIDETLGPVEILVSNAGITRDGLVLRMADADFTDVLDTNLTGGFRVARRVVRSMMRARWGRIIFVSSVVGLGGQAGQANYAASKAGLIGLTKSLAKELGSRGVTVNAIAPGFIETDMTGALTEDQRAAVRGRIPLARIGSPLDIAHTAVFLASDRAAYITGAVIQVDGGLSM